MPALSTIAASVLGRAIYDSAKPIVRRVSKYAESKGWAKTNVLKAFEKQVDPRVKAYWPVSLVQLLPHGVTQKTVDTVIATPEFAACARQMVSLKVLDDPSPDRRRDVRLNLQRLMLAHVPVAHRSGMSGYAEAFLDHFEEMCEAIAGAIKASVKDTNEVIQMAYTSVSIDTMTAIERYTAVLSGRDPSVADYSIWVERYAESFKAAHDSIDLPDLEARTRLPYKSLFVQPNMLEADYHTLNMLRITGETLSAINEKKLDDFVAGIDRAVLLGDPGAGKSTTSTIAMILSYKRHARVPFIVLVRDLKEAKFNLVDLLATILRKSHELRVSSESIERLLHEGQCTVLFDGLDENQHGTSRAEIAEQIEALARTYPYASFLVTCRYVGYLVARLDKNVFAEHAIARFSMERQVAQYAHYWFLAKNGRVDKQLLADFMVSARSMPDLVTNPLLLAFILIIYNGRKDIPRTRPILYRQCVDLLLGEWDHRRNILVDLPDREAVRTALSRIADLENRLGRAQDGMIESEIADDLIPFLSDRVVASEVTARRFMVELLKLCRGRAWIFTDMGKNRSGEPVFSFTHGSFREFFLASYVVRTERDLDRVSGHLFELAIAGRNEIYAQVCLSLIDAGHLSAASDVVARILDRIEAKYELVDTSSVRLSGERDSISNKIAIRASERSTAVRYLARASDSIPLTRTVAQRLISVAIRQLAASDVAPLTVLMEETYKHREAVLELLEEAINDAILLGKGEDGLRYLWFAANVGFLTQYMTDRLGEGSVRRLRDLAVSVRPHLTETQLRFGVRLALSVMTGASDGQEQLGSSATEFAVYMEECFAAYKQPILGLGAQCIAAWVFDCLGAKSREVLPMASVAAVLRAVGRHARMHDFKIPQLHLPQVSGLHLTPLHLLTILQQILPRAFAYDADYRVGLTYFTVAVIELTEGASQDENLRAIFRDWLQRGVRDERLSEVLAPWVANEWSIWEQGWSQDVS